MKYSFACPLCKKTVTVDSSTEEEALELILSEGKKHAKDVHPDIPVPEPMLKSMIKAGMKKENE